MVSIHPKNDAVLEFWSWFAAISDKLGDNLESAELLDELDRRVGCLGVPAWEVGPGLSKENSLAISPDGDPALLPLTQRIVSLAPDLTRWEFHSSRQARANGLEFSITSGSGTRIDIDAQSWRYVLYRFPDGVFDIVLEQGNLGQVRGEDRYTAAIVLLDGLIGEGMRLLRIREVEPVVALSVEQEIKAGAISSLLEHMESLC